MTSNLKKMMVLGAIVGIANLGAVSALLIAKWFHREVKELEKLLERP